MAPETRHTRRHGRQASPESQYQQQMGDPESTEPRFRGPKPEPEQARTTYTRDTPASPDKTIDQLGPNGMLTTRRGTEIPRARWFGMIELIEREMQKRDQEIELRSLARNGTGSSNPYTSGTPGFTTATMPDGQIFPVQLTSLSTSTVQLAQPHDAPRTDSLRKFPRPKSQHASLVGGSYQTNSGPRALGQQNRHRKPLETMNTLTHRHLNRGRGARYRANSSPLPLNYQNRVRRPLESRNPLSWPLLR